MADITISRILYMEDDPGLARLLQKSLQRRGYIVDTAPDGEEGLRMIGISRYDLVLVDYNMPFCGGIDVIERLSEQGALLPVIMVTGEGNEEIAVEALKLGASDYVVKDTEMKYLDLLPMVIDRVLYQQYLLRERRQMEEAVRESEERYRRLVELSPDGIAIHADGKFLFFNSAGSKCLGATAPAQLIGKSVLDVVHRDYHALVGERLLAMEAPGQGVPWVKEKFIRVDGSEVDVEVAAISFTYQGKQAVQLIFRDITERKQIEERLERLALYDALTGLPNRALFFDRMKQLLALAKRNQYSVAVLYMDLDRFKSVNDAFGHEAGDVLLVETAKRMSACTRKADTLARMGGDEFIGVCAKIAAPRDAEIVAKKIVETLSRPFSLGDQESRISVSIGISVYPQDGEDVETLVKNADEAMYRVKQRKTGGYAFYSAK